MNVYARALTRFWWVVALGCFVAVLAMAVVSGGAEKSYTAVAEVLVTSPQAPYVRISVTSPQSVPTTPQGAGAGLDGRGASALATQLVTNAPELNTLVRAANLYPFLIESDLVALRREAMFGELPGEVSARAIFAVASALRFDPSDIPIIQIAGAGATARDATKISQATTEAFASWIKISQDDARLAPRERIVIQQIKRPTEVFVSGGTPTSLVLLVGAAIILAFGFFAVVLDRTLVRSVDGSEDESPTAIPDYESEGGLVRQKRSGPANATSATLDVPSTATQEVSPVFGRDVHEVQSAAAPETSSQDEELRDSAEVRQGRTWA